MNRKILCIFGWYKYKINLFTLKVWELFKELKRLQYQQVYILFFSFFTLSNFIFLQLILPYKNYFIEQKLLPRQDVWIVPVL